MHLSNNQLARIAQHHPQCDAYPATIKAAVALILRDGCEGAEVLMMQRATHPGDPWSGQMGFPGGKIEVSDASLRAAAIRETQEEVAVGLAASDYIGQLDDTYSIRQKNQYHAQLSSFVFKLSHPVDPVGNHEVADLVWMPLAYCHQRERLCHFNYRSGNADFRMAGIRLNESKQQTVWGVSLRVLMHFNAVIGTSVQYDDLVALA